MLKRFVSWALLPAAAIASLVSMTALFSEYHFVFDMISHFRLQYIAGLIPILLISLCFKRHLFAFFFCTVIGFHLYAVSSTQMPSVKRSDTGREHVLRVMSSNLQASNTKHDLLIEYIREVDPDILVVQEMTLAWHAKLSSELSEFPYYIGKPQLNPFGIGVFSKLNFKSAKIMTFTRRGNPSIEFVVDYSNSEIVLIGTHSLPPITTSLFNKRNEHFQHMSEHIAELTQPVVLVGDLNSTPWSAHFRKLLNTSRLKDSRRGFGVHPTWPTTMLPAIIPIDHILVGESVKVVNRQVSRNIGSDHRSVWVDIALQGFIRYLN